MNRTVKNAAAVLGGIGAGAAMMYLLDPDRGARRRSLIRDKAVGTTNDMKRAVVKKSKHFRNRAQGLLHEAGSLISPGNGAAESAAINASSAQVNDEKREKNEL